MEHDERRAWRLRRQVLPQHTDHAGVMWHGAYVAWLEEARVDALAQAGLRYADLSSRGYELPVVRLTIDYKQALIHGDSVELLSWSHPRTGVKLPWISRFVRADGRLAAEAQVELVLVDLSAGPQQRRLLRRPPTELALALERLQRGPTPQ